MKYKKITVVAELSIPVEYISYGYEDRIAQDLKNEFIKIKSGLYENVACGDVTEVLKIE